MLREVFVMTLLLNFFNWTREIVVEMDTSDSVSAGVLSQQGDVGF